MFEGTVLINDNTIQGVVRHQLKMMKKNKINAKELIKDFKLRLLNVEPDYKENIVIYNSKELVFRFHKSRNIDIEVQKFKELFKDILLGTNIELDLLIDIFKDKNTIYIFGRK